MNRFTIGKCGLTSARRTVTVRRQQWRLLVAAVLTVLLTTSVPSRADGILCTSRDTLGWIDTNTLSAANDMVMEGHLAYVASPVGLLVVDVTDPSHPAEIGGAHQSDPLLQIGKSDSIAVAASDTTFYVFDVSDPTQPQLRGSIPLNRTQKIVIAGLTAYVTVASAGTQILDLSDLDNPEIVGNLPSTMVLRVQGTLAYALHSGDLVIYDISAPAVPVELSTFHRPNSITDVAVQGTLAYLAGRPPALQILDVSDPSNPNVVCEYNQLSFSTLIEVQGDTAYLYHRARVDIIDVSDPSAPATLGECRTFWAATRIDIENGVLACAVRSDVAPAMDPAIQLIDIEAIRSPSLLSKLTLFTHNHDLSVVGNLAYLTMLDGIRIYDFSDPRHPHWTGWIQVDRFCAVIDDQLVHTGGFNEFSILDVSSLAHPVEIGHIDLGTDSEPVYAQSAGRVGSFILLGVFLSNDDRLYSIDVTDPTTPTIVNSIDLPSAPVHVRVFGSMALVSTRSHGLYVFDVANPASPQLIVAFSAYTRVGACAMSGNILYLTDTRFGLRVFDMTNPANPQMIGSYGPTSPTDVQIVGSTAFVSDDGLRMLDVSDPTSPVLKGWYFDSAARVDECAVSSELVLLAQADGNYSFIDLRGTCEDCAVDFIGDGHLDFYDVQAFLNAFADGDPAADLVPDAMLDLFDVQAFLDGYAAGCG